MTPLTSVTPADYDAWQLTLAEDYAVEKIAAGSWPEDAAIQRALDENAALLPDGAGTVRMLTSEPSRSRRRWAQPA